MYDCSMEDKVYEQETCPNRILGDLIILIFGKRLCFLLQKGVRARLDRSSIFDSTSIFALKNDTIIVRT